jgi:hypothetical protein
MHGDSKIGAVLALALAVLALAGCGETVIDDTKAEDAVFADLESLDVAVQSVDCPEDVEVKAGETFECAVTVGGARQDATATLRILNEDADVRFVDYRRQR